MARRPQAGPDASPGAAHGEAAARAILVGVDFGKGSFDASLDELAQLAESAGDVAVDRGTANRAG